MSGRQQIPNALDEFFTCNTWFNRDSSLKTGGPGGGAAHQVRKPLNFRLKFFG
jgi:hypothetical protein